MHVARPGGGLGRFLPLRHDDHDALVAEAVGHFGHQGLRQRVGPVEVLDDDELRPTLGPGDQHLQHRVERLALALLRLHQARAVDRIANAVVPRQEGQDLDRFLGRRSLDPHQRTPNLVGLQGDPLGGLEIELLAERVDKGMERPRVAARHALEDMRVAGSRLHLASEVGDQPRLADAGVAGDMEDLARSRLRAVPIGAADGKLQIAPGQRRLRAALARSMAAALRLPQRDGVVETLQRPALQALIVERAAGQPVGVLGDHDCVRLGLLLDACGQRRRDADDVLELGDPGILGLHDDHLAGRDADPDLQRHRQRHGLVDRTAARQQVERAGDRAWRLVLRSQREAEECRAAVALQAVEIAAEEAYGFKGLGVKVALQDRIVFGIEDLQELGRADDVEEQGANLPALTCDGPADIQRLMNSSHRSDCECAGR